MNPLSETGPGIGRVMYKGSSQRSQNVYELKRKHKPNLTRKKTNKAI